MKKEPSVELLSYTTNPEILVAQATSLCYSEKGLKKGIGLEEAKKLIKRVPRKHTSIFEHAKYTFFIEGISRACSHELVRYRIASPSQRSQRYVDESNFDVHVPQMLIEIMGEEWVDKKIEESKETYKEILEAYKKRGLTGQVANQDARYLLPNATETKMINSFNARSLLNLFNQRMCNRAQDEIRNVAHQMFSLVYPTAPTIFEGAGPDCLWGKCLEGKLSCGKPEEIKERIERLKK